LGLTYLRLHIPQATVAALFVGATQADVSRDLRHLLPLIQQCLPCPGVWEEVPTDQTAPARTHLTAAQLADGRRLVGANHGKTPGGEDDGVRPGQMGELS
jgi:hypothetical protein